MEKHPKVGRNLVLRPRKDFRNTDNPCKQSLNVAATCKLDGNARTCLAAILYPSTHKAQAYTKRLPQAYGKDIFMGKTYL